MNTINGLFSTFANAFRGATGTGLDTIEATPVEALVAERLVATDAVPATNRDTVEAFLAVAGHSPREEELASTERFLREFAWAA